MTKRNRTPWIWLALACTAAGAAAAQPVADPMRPANVAPGPATGSGTGAGGPILQSVLISPGRKTAVISGEAVDLGGKYGDARVVKMTESEVVLKSGENLTTLKLFPNVEKRTAVAARRKADTKRQ